MTQIWAFATPARLAIIRAAAEWKLKARPEARLPPVFWTSYRRDLLRTGMPLEVAATFRDGFVRVVEAEMRSMIRSRQQGDGAA